MLLFPCACGHLHTDALLTSTLGAGAAWFPFFRYERTRVYDRCLAVFFVFISTLIFIKNFPDVLWFGHEPLLR